MQQGMIHPHLLHPLTGEPLRAVGVVGGRTIWPIMGASPDDPVAGDSGPDDGGDGAGTDGDDGDSGGDDGDTRLEQARQEAIARRRELKPWKELAREFGVTPEQAREALAAAKKPNPKQGDGGQGDEVDADAIRRDAEREANDRANARIVRSEVKALAAATFADPADAPLYVDLSQFEVDEDGEVDEDEIKKALAAVIKSKPHLAKTGKAPRPDPSQGPRGKGKADTAPGVARLRQAYADSAQ